MPSQIRSRTDYLIPTSGIMWLFHTQTYLKNLTLLMGFHTI